MATGELACGDSRNDRFAILLAQGMSIAEETARSPHVPKLPM